MHHNKIFIEQERSTGDFLLRMPADALPAFYQMLYSAPLISRRWFHQAKDYLESNYSQCLRNSPLCRDLIAAPKPPQK